MGPAFVHHRAESGYCARANTSCGVAGRAEAWTSFTPYGIQLDTVELSAGMFGGMSDDSDDCYDDGYDDYDPYSINSRHRWDHAYDYALSMRY